MLSDSTTQEMTRLYQQEGETMQAIAGRFGVIKQTVQARLSRAGIKGRIKHQLIDKSTLERLYQQNISLQEIAVQLRTNIRVVRAALKFHRIPKRQPIKVGGKYADVFRVLKVGQTSEVSISTKAPHAQLHRAAGHIGIKISLRAAGTNRFAATRIG